MKTVRCAVTAGAIPLIVLALSLGVAHATTAISTDGTYKYGASYTITITGADSSNPSTFSMSSIAHFVLSTGAAQNPYTMKIELTSPGTGSDGAGCGTGQCTTPTAIKVSGWGPGALSFTGTGTNADPWVISVSATVQANNPCDTAPVMVSFKQSGADGDTVAILEAGVGGVCGPSQVPEFGLSIAGVVTSLAPVLFLLRRRAR